MSKYRVIKVWDIEADSAEQAMEKEFADGVEIISLTAVDKELVSPFGKIDLSAF